MLGEIELQSGRTSVIAAAVQIGDVGDKRMDYL
jgi:hypothetical protein